MSLDMIVSVTTMESDNNGGYLQMSIVTIVNL